VSLVPVIGAVGEQKTKPTQQSVRELRALGLSPDVVICRSTQPLTAETKQKISLFCHVATENVISVHDVSNTYKVPLLLEEQHLSRLLVKKLQLDTTTTRADLVASGALLREPVFGKWQEMADTFDLISADNVAAVRIALVGKYTGLADAYLSVIKSLQHAALHAKRRLIIDWIVASDLETNAEATAHKEAWDKLKAANGILVPGGFGDRGIEGKIAAANYARVNKIPYLGICLGLQIAVIEYARNVLKWEDANSEEFDTNKKSTHHVVVFMPEIDRTHMGGNMRLGLRRSIVKNKESWATKLYGGATEINERHRHRYEVNPELVPQLEAAGLMFVAQDETGKRMEILELDRKTHPFFFATQYHSEFKSRPLKPSPPFVGLLMAASGQL
jgi:CTP synthase